MKFKKGIVKMMTVDGFRDETALISGPFAVHQSRNPEWKLVRGSWTVTHVPTGKRFFPDAVSEKAARRFCEDVADLCDWTVENPKPSTDLMTEAGLAFDRALWRARGVEELAVPS